MDPDMLWPDQKAEVRALHQQLLDAWNRRSAADYARLFREDANVVGFDGSLMNGRGEIEAEINRIFADHQTAQYIGKVREVRLLAPGVAVLQAVVGMTPPGGNDLNPAANAVQTLVAVRQAGRWKIAVFQNTPAAFHGRPEMAEALTQELRAELHSGSGKPV